MKEKLKNEFDFLGIKNFWLLKDTIFVIHMNHPGIWNLELKPSQTKQKKSPTCL